MQVPYYPNGPPARCIDAKAVSFTYMAYIVANTKWANLMYEHIYSMFQQRNRYDVLGQWPTLNEIDETTQISRDVTDEEILAYARSLDDREDRDAFYMVRKFRTNQLLRSS